MTRLLASAGVIFLSGMALGQSAQTSPIFEAADVHASQPTSAPFMRGGFLTGGRYELHTASMVDLIRTAYGVDADAVFGGPSWLDSDRFEMIAKAGSKSSEAERALMLQALLADRFKLVVHKEDKPLDVFTLTSGRRVLLKESAGGGDPECTPAPPTGNGPPPYIVVNCRNMTMADFAKQSHLMAGGYITHPMVDLTGLTGTYDFTVKWTPRGALKIPGSSGADANPGISYFEAVDKQLGLKIVAAKRPMPAIVVDSVNRAPTENAPGVTKNLPSAPTEFEVATVKPSKPGNTNQRIQPKPGGRIEIENVPLKMLIGLAWNLEQDQDRILGGPKWVETSHYDIVAKTTDFRMSEPPPFDTVRLMLRSLLADNFKLVVHNEDQPVAVWTLVAGKRGTKLKEADPASRAGCQRSIGESGAGASALPMITYSCLNTTMAQLADMMHTIAGGYVDHVAVDMTGLKGAYDFTIGWTPRNFANGGGQGAASGNGQTPVAAEPTGAITFFDAVDKQLGLRLEKGEKRPLPVLIIDHVEQPAAEN